jgi:hypothetical protein
MNKLVVLVVCLILVSSIVPSVLPSPYVTTSIGSHYLSIDVEAPEEARVNENYVVIIIVQPIGKVYINSINVEFYNLIKDTFYEPIYKETILFSTEISSRIEKTYSLKSKDEGSSYCRVNYDYVVDKGTPFEKSYSNSVWLHLTKIREKTYDELYEKFEEQTKRTMFFALTTLIFALTTVYFAWKCRKLGKKQGKR